MKKKIVLILVLLFLFVPTFVIASDSRIVYITKSGSKFHSYDCKTLGSNLTKTTVDNAQNKRI